MLKIETLREKAEIQAVKLGLTGKDLEMIQNAAHAVYEEVSYDMEPDFKKRRTCRRSTILEVALDAGRTESYLRRTLGIRPNRLSSIRTQEEKDADPKILQIFGRVGYEALKDLVGPAFPFEEYEVGG